MEVSLQISSHILVIRFTVNGKVKAIYMSKDGVNAIAFAVQFYPVQG